MTPDAEIERVKAALTDLDPLGTRFGQVIRETYDQIYNGQLTGRYRYDQLMKTEKTHFGTLVEINLQREFKFTDGREYASEDGRPVDLDYQIAGIDVDCKWSMKFGGWMIPPEAQHHICMILWGDDAKSKWSLGLVRADPEILNLGANRDSKAQIKAEHRDRIHWIWENADLPPNVLLQLDEAMVKQIMVHSFGTKRVNDLFRLAQQRRISRAAVATVARQLDPMKRVRYDGGARSVLQPEGIIILSGDYHSEIARALGLPVPLRKEFISARVVPAEGDYEGPTAELQGERWRLAEDIDPVVDAPSLGD